LKLCGSRKDNSNQVGISGCIACVMVAGGVCTFARTIVVAIVILRYVEIVDVLKFVLINVIRYVVIVVLEKQEFV